MILKIVRIVLAVIFFICITFLLLGIPDSTYQLSWMYGFAKIQFLPALLSLNFVALAIVIILTLLLGRVYCSVICPLGVLQDIIAFFGRMTKKNRKLPYSYSEPKNWLRYVVLGLYVIAVIFGAGFFVTLLAPYGNYGRFIQSLLYPSAPMCIISSAIFIGIAIVAFKNGRTYCNTICPVGTILGFLSRFSFLKPVIDTSKCNGCKLCARNCKASCINPEIHSIDYSRCVACMDCLHKCKQGAISYRHGGKNVPLKSEKASIDQSKRNFLTVAGVMATSYAMAQKHKVDGGLATIIAKDAPKRDTSILPPGSVSASHFAQHCTGCQLCVSSCPNKILRPSGNLMTLMQPTVSYEFGFCRPECTKCSEVCPAGAIKPIMKEEKKEIKIGLAVAHRDECVKLPNGDSCGNCSRHCPSSAISMVADKNGHLIPVVDESRCIGCGACEYLCPVRPISAIRVEGYSIHRIN